MWKKLAEYLVKGAVWAAGHPDEVAAILAAVQGQKK